MGRDVGVDVFKVETRLSNSKFCFFKASIWEFKFWHSSCLQQNKNIRKNIKMGEVLAVLRNIALSPSLQLIAFYTQILACFLALPT